MTFPSDSWLTLVAEPAPPATIVFVEGESDRIALQTLAVRRGTDLDATGVRIVPMGGSSAFRAHLDEATARFGGAVRLGGLCDEGEILDVVSALDQAGFGSSVGASNLAEHGFFVCRRDLEDELIRAVGTDGVLDAIDNEGDGPSLRRLQRQPAWRDRALHDQLRRFMSSQSGRKARYARRLTESVQMAAVPAPLDGLLRHATED